VHARQGYYHLSNASNPFVLVFEVCLIATFAWAGLKLANLLLSPVEQQITGMHHHSWVKVLLF
jgi:hypothetical protein